MTEKKNRSIFRVLLFPLLSVLVGEIVLMLSILLFGNVFQQMSDNMEDIFQGQVENRRSYLLNEMIGNWSDLETLTEEVNQCIQMRLDDGTTSLSELCSDSAAYTPVLNELAALLIDAMYSKQVSGAFVVLADPSGTPEERGTLPGLYFRDRDPQAQPSQVLEDILAQRAPHGVIQTGRLSTDTDWTPMFTLEDSLEKDYFKPYFTALADGAVLDTEDYGYWTSAPYTLSGDDASAIAYSIPLILRDGTVYGVLGIELLTNYMASLMPEEELHSSGEGGYLLAVARDGGSELESVLASGHRVDGAFLLSEDGSVQVTADSGDYYAMALPLTLYSRNAPFDTDKWYLVGCVPSEQLYGFTEQLLRYCMLAVMATLIFGMMGILLVSYRLTRPIQKLSSAVAQAQGEGQIPSLPDVRIMEIDQLLHAVTQLSQEVLESSTRFLSIMEMASVDIAGFEIKEDSDAVFVTENYFPLLGMRDVDIKNLSRDEFIHLREKLMCSLKYTQEQDGSLVYAVPSKSGDTRYVRAEQEQVGSRLIGLIEDVTASILERKKVEAERDYDPLTGLLSRQGFRREASRLFLDKDTMKVAALLMLDLDKLKIVNDTFGHTAGDSYITTAGGCFRKSAPDNALCARISGDEFLILYHGFESKAVIWQYVQELFRQLQTTTFLLPDGTDHGVSASGGVAWYPDDTEDLSELMRYSDFAMYCVKKTERGNVVEFDPSAYQEMLRQNRCQQEFYHLLEDNLAFYHFQPIFDGKTGAPFAYEALMRVDMPNLRSPVTVLQLARRTGRMQNVETMAFFTASETYERLLEQGAASPEALLFINSMADTSMSHENDELYRQRFGHLQSRIVIEITETENLDLDLLRKKQSVEGFSGMLALDDYGSGYNTELNLLELEPDFIKVDMAIIRNIHLDENKQQLVRNIVEYAHERGMRIIAEGLETPEEVKTSLDLGVDLLQGYFLSRPAAIPQSISEEAGALIRSYWS